ncbi:hypothetical protein MFIFM68171_05779 [Madurella fahalii]|uniref:Uncharacterized protein n=1 Tax=Madurella fahalii TaxID=1157608 RepID=A0ABQ0GD01_9PEZI
MLRSTRLVVLAVLLVLLPHSASAAGIGSNMLDECPCGPIYKTMVRCQKIRPPEGLGDGITDCICVPNPDGWYPYIHNCRACLSGNDFFDNLSGMMTQLLTSCTEAGGNVVSDGESICASNAMWEYCASLKDGSDGQPSWASFERFSDAGDNSNATQLLSFEEPPQESGTSSETPQESGTSSETAASETMTATSTATGTGTLSTTTASQGTATTSTPSSAARSGYTTQSGHALGLLFTAGAGYLLV